MEVNKYIALRFLAAQNVTYMLCFQRLDRAAQAQQEWDRSLDFGSYLSGLSYSKGQKCASGEML